MIHRTSAAGEDIKVILNNGRMNDVDFIYVSFDSAPSNAEIRISEGDDIVFSVDVRQVGIIPIDLTKYSTQEDVTIEVLNSSGVVAKLNVVTQ